MKVSFVNTDVFCFFPSENAIFVPEEEWFTAIVSSLKLKKNVLILEQVLDQIPPLNPALRWQITEKSLWITPRSLSVLFEALNETSGTYSSVKAHLTTFK